jgi:hypothetical protein
MLVGKPRRFNDKASCPLPRKFGRSSLSERRINLDRPNRAGLRPVRIQFKVQNFSLGRKGSSAREEACERSERDQPFHGIGPQLPSGFSHPRKYFRESAFVRYPGSE